MATPSSPAFLKPQDGDTAAESSDRTSDTTPEKTDKGFPRWILFTALGILLVAGASGYLLFLRHRPKTHNAKGNSIAGATAPKAAVPVPTTDLPLDPFVVNLADASGHSYARIGLTLQLIAPAAASGKSQKKDAAAGDVSGPRDMVRDTIITVLNQEQSTNLLAPGGKEHLKQAIRAAVTARDPQIKVADIYFTEFLIQQ